MTRLLQLCAALLLAAAAAGAQALNYAGTPFEIEMIVFERPHGIQQGGETWPSAPRLQYPNYWVDFASGTDGAPVLTPAPTRLDNKVAALERSRDYRVLFHRAWRQVLQQKRNAPAILISGGNSFGGHRELEGSVTLSVSHYLHMSTNLWLNDFGTGQAAGGILLPPIPRPSSGEEPMNLSSAGRTAAPGVESPVFAQHVALLQQERRLRSGELHYFDHPKLGILLEVRTLPKTAPAEATGK